MIEAFKSMDKGLSLCYDIMNAGMSYASKTVELAQAQVAEVERIAKRATEA